MTDEPLTPRIRDAADDEDRLIRYLSRRLGQVAMDAWHGLPPELKEGYSMPLTISAALTHSLGLMLAAAPKEAIAADDPTFGQFVETTCDLVRANAITARQRLLEELAGTTPKPEGPAAPLRVTVPTPKFTM